MKTTLEAMNLTSSRMARLIDDLINMSSIRRSPGATYRADGSRTAAAADGGERGVAAPGHPIELTTAVSSLVGEWDASRLARVFENLLNNAAKYSAEDGAKIVVALREDTDEQGRWAVVEMRDHGIGIPAADLPRIFDQFYRARNTSRLRQGPLGLASQAPTRLSSSTAVRST